VIISVKCSCSHALFPTDTEIDKVESDLTLDNIEEDTEELVIKRKESLKLVESKDQEILFGSKIGVKKVGCERHRVNEAVIPFLSLISKAITGSRRTENYLF